MRIVQKTKRYGGAVKPWLCTVVKIPSSEMIVGAKRGRLAKLTLTEKYMMARR